MIKTNDGYILFIPDEEMDHSPEFIMHLAVAGESKDLIKNRLFQKSLDNILTHIYSTTDIWLENDTYAINRIEEVRQILYEISLEEILKIIDHEPDHPNKEPCRA